MPLQATSGAASYDAFGGGVAAVPNYIEDVFSSYLWTTSGSDQTLTTGIDMTKGALTWIKSRSNAFPHILQTGIGGGVLPNNALSTNSTAAYAGGNYRIADSTTGFTMGVDYYTGTPQTAVVWTFRKAPKFFDVVTYTGDGTNGRAISHSLGSVPGCILVKCTSASQAWRVYHRSLPTDYNLELNATDGAFSDGNVTSPTSTTFTVNNYGAANTNGNTYVAYLFAHDAGGFGLTGTDNVISCGSFDANNGEVINLGYEPQWLLYKDSVSVSNWRIADTMRGLTNLAGTNAQTIQQLVPNSTAIEGANSGPVLTSTGFTWNQSGGGNKHIYIAIRRGPMKVPTSGTSVFSPVARTGTGAGSVSVTGIGFPPDWAFYQQRNSAGGVGVLNDRLRGNEYFLPSDASAGTVSTQYGFGTMLQDGAKLGTNTALDGGNASGVNYINYFFRRAPSFFDEVCYTGNGGNPQVVTHNLTVVPEMILVKARSIGYQWIVYHSGLGTGSFMELNSTASAVAYAAFPAVSATTFSADSSYNRASGQTFVAYLFATCAGVSKVGSYTGNGSSQTINCGFTGGARFVMVKATSTTGNWIVADSARGIVAGNDPALYLNSTAAEVTGLDWIDADNSGFVVNETATIAANTNGVSYIFFAVA